MTSLSKVADTSTVANASFYDPKETKDFKDQTSKAASSGSSKVNVFSFEEMSKALDAISDVQPCYSQGNAGGIWRIASLGQDRIAGACYDHRARVWSFAPAKENSTRGAQQMVLRKGKSGECLSLLNRESESTLITGSRKMMQFWDTKSGKLIKTVSEPEHNSTGFYSMAELGAGRIASGPCQRPPKQKNAWSYDIRVWNPSMKIESLLKGHTGAVPALCSLSDSRLLSCSADNTLRIWDLKKTSCSAVIQAHDDYIYCASPLGKDCAVTGSRDRTIKIWDLNKAKQVSSLHIKDDVIAHDSTVYDVHAVMENCVLSASRDTYVKVWDTRTSASVKTLAPEDGFVYCVTSLPNGNIAAGTSGIQEEGSEMNDNAHVAVWDLRKA